MPTGPGDRTPIAGARYSRFTVRPMTGTFGALVSGVRITDALTDEALFTDLRTAWVRYQVLFFRDQDLAPEQHLALGKRFGDIQEQGYVGSLEGHPGVWVQEYPAMYKGPVNDINWHADRSFRTTPTRGSLLYALDVPDGAGDTVWADMCAAYDELSPAWQRFLDPLTTIHDNVARNFQRVFDSMGGEALDKMRKFLTPTEHPLVCTHPESRRRFLFISELLTREVTGMSDRESRAVLDFLFAHQTRPEFQCRWHWEPRSLALWDNYSTIHRGIFDFGQSRRLMHRVSFHDHWRPA
ncbi:MAG: TauD/TfdA family dioxygenase [Gammaproteobacteria bacterium]